MIGAAAPYNTTWRHRIRGELDVVIFTRPHKNVVSLEIKNRMLCVTKVANLPAPNHIAYHQPPQTRIPLVVNDIGRRVPPVVGSADNGKAARDNSNDDDVRLGRSGETSTVEHAG
jgi:hypothetical protein